MIRILAILFALVPALAAAQDDLIDPDVFGAEAIGKTYWFSEQGNHYGAEQYFPDQTTIWQGRNGECKKGRWWAEGEAMCFAYEDDPTPDCWVMWEGDGGRIMIESLRPLEGPEDSALVLELIRRTPLPISCTGTLLGV